MAGGVRSPAGQRGRSGLSESLFERIEDPRLRRAFQAILSEVDREGPEFEQDRFRRRRIKAAAPLEVRQGQGLCLMANQEQFRVADDGSLENKPQGKFDAAFDATLGTVDGRLDPGAKSVAAPTKAEFDALVDVFNDNVAELQFQITEMRKMLAAAGIHE